MSGFDQLERQLLDSVLRRRRGAFARLRGERRPRLGGLAIALGAAVAVAVALAAVVLPGRNRPESTPAHLPSSPHPTPIAPRPSTERAAGYYVSMARRTTFRKDPACQPGLWGRGGPTIDDGAPDRELLEALGVLRRPATAADRLPGSFIQEPGVMTGRGVFVKYIRLARVADGISFYVVPAARVGPPRAPARCAREMAAELRRELSRPPTRIRASMLELGLRSIARFAADPGHDRVGEGVLDVETIPGGGGWAGGGPTVGELEQYGDPGSIGSVVHGIVPDPVATVTYVFPADRTGGHRLPPLTVTMNVVENVFVGSIARIDEGAHPSKQIWRSASGAVLKTISGLNP